MPFAAAITPCHYFAIDFDYFRLFFDAIISLFHFHFIFRFRRLLHAIAMPLFSLRHCRLRCHAIAYAIFIFRFRH
jgi:hypothetical protein